MKIVPLRVFGTGEEKLETVKIIRTVVERGGPNGLGIGEIEARVRVLRALDKSVTADSLALEDSDHATLMTALNQFRFGGASIDLAALIADIRDAKEPPAPAPPKI